MARPPDAVSIRHTSERVTLGGAAPPAAQAPHA